MAATAAAVAPEEDMELRDLLVQTLESSGVLNRVKVGGSGGAWPRSGPRSRARCGRRASCCRWRGREPGPGPAQPCGRGASALHEVRAGKRGRRGGGRGAAGAARGPHLPAPVCICPVLAPHLPRICLHLPRTTPHLSACAPYLPRTCPALAPYLPRTCPVPVRTCRGRAPPRPRPRGGGEMPRRSHRSGSLSRKVF